MTKISVIIPAYNEEKSIGLVIQAIPNLVSEIIVIDNNSTDNTNKNAVDYGATVLTEKRKGYGYACLKGLEYISNQKVKPDIIVFLDGDYSDYPEEMHLLLQPILTYQANFVIGARVKRQREKGAMTPQQVFGNWLATFLMKLFFNSKFTDLGPFRAIKYSTLLQLNMQDKTYGWTVEMQLKVLKRNIAYLEVPVHYKNRIGVSKVSGTVKGTIMAGIKIIGWILKYTL